MQNSKNESDPKKGKGKGLVMAAIYEDTIYRPGGEKELQPQYIPWFCSEYHRKPRIDDD